MEIYEQPRNRREWRHDEYVVWGREVEWGGAQKQRGDCQSGKLGSRYRLDAVNISIDYAVMERSDNVNVVPCEMGWSDIGA